MTKDYELVPHEEVARLQSELERLRKQQPKDHPSQKEIQLHNSVERLNHSISKLLILFGKASQEVDKEPDVTTKISVVQTQTEKIASSLVSIIEMIQEQQKQLSHLTTLYGKLSTTKVLTNAPSEVKANPMNIEFDMKKVETPNQQRHPVQQTHPRPIQHAKPVHHEPPAHTKFQPLPHKVTNSGPLPPPPAPKKPVFSKK